MPALMAHLLKISLCRTDIRKDKAEILVFQNLWGVSSWKKKKSKKELLSERNIHTTHKSLHGLRFYPSGNAEKLHIHVNVPRHEKLQKKKAKDLVADMTHMENIDYA